VFASDVSNKMFDWIESASRALHTINNCAIEPSAQTLLASRNFDQMAELVYKTLGVWPDNAFQKELLERILQLMSRLVKNDEGARRVMGSKDLLLKLFVYYTRDETHKSALITLHTLMVRVDRFREILFETHNFTAASLDGFVRKGKASYTSAKEAAKWDDYVYVCSSLSAFVTVFPERSEDFKELIVPLIKVCADTTEKVRKNSAVLLAKLAQNENNKKHMQANHGTEVLYSLQGQLM